MTYYAIQARLTGTDGEWNRNAQLPTFYLHSNVQGLLSEEDAERVALDLIDTIRKAGWATHAFASAVALHD